MPEFPAGRRLIGILFLAAACFAVSSGCAKTGGVRRSAARSIDLMGRFSPATPAVPEANIQRNLSVIRKGLRKDALILVAPATVRASLRGEPGRWMLEGFATQVFNIGDGIRMDLYLDHDGERRLVGSRYLDAGRRAEDREWIPIRFPLDLGEEGQLEIAVSAGPQGDLVADWLALSSLRLSQRQSTP